MTDQYVARDRETGFEVTVTGDFPAHPDDRMRIARTTTLFTKLMSTLLQSDESQRRMGFRAIETQLEIADALIRQDHTEVQRLVRETLTSMGVSEDQLREMAKRLSEAGGLDPRIAEELGKAFGLDPASEAEAEAADADAPQLNPNLLSQIRDAMGPADDETEEAANEPPAPADPASLLEASMRVLEKVNEARDLTSRLMNELMSDGDGPVVWLGTSADADNARADLDRLEAELAELDLAGVGIAPDDVEWLRGSLGRLRNLVNRLSPPTDGADAPANRAIAPESDDEDDEDDQPDEHEQRGSTT